MHPIFFFGNQNGGGAWGIGPVEPGSLAQRIPWNLKLAPGVKLLEANSGEFLLYGVPQMPGGVPLDKALRGEGLCPELVISGVGRIVPALMLSTAEWATEIGVSPSQAARLAPRAEGAQRIGERAWAIPSGTPKPDALPTGARAHKRPTAAAHAAEQYVRHEGG